MKTLLLACIILFSCFVAQAQDNKGSMQLEITKLNVGLNGGFYSGRDQNSNSGFSTAGQIYFPFRWAVDYDQNFKNERLNEYDNRIFLIRPSFIFQAYEDKAYGFGLANQLSFKLVKSVYLEYQIGVVYNEATISAQPDIYSGFSLHHTASISAPISKKFSLFGAYMHLSNAGLIDNENSIVDVFGLGIRFNSF